MPENTVLSPHVGYVTEETYTIFYGETIRNIGAWMKGESLPKLLTAGQYRVHKARSDYPRI